MINITMLGTSCMVPTKERNVTSIYLEYNGEGILIDCGEGTQRQMNIANISRTKVKKILISHWHGDHVSGLLGLIQTVSNNEQGVVIDIYGPKETKKRFSCLMDSTYFGNLNKITLNVYDLNITKLTKFYENDQYYLEAIPLDHNVPTLGFNFVEKDRRKIKVAAVQEIGIPEGPILGKLQEGKSILFKGKKYESDELTFVVQGKKVSFVMDTSYTKNAISLAQDADLLICESSYMDQHTEKGEQYKHLTANQAALIAQNANAKKLVLTHFSQRYTDLSPLQQEARDIFPETSAGYDFMKIKL